MTTIIEAERRTAENAPTRAGLPSAVEPLARIRRIMVPVDGSAFSEHALPWALELAHHTDAQVDLVLVHVDPARAFLGEMPFADRWQAEAREQEAAYLEEMADEVGPAESMSIDTVLLEGRSVSRELARYAAQRGIDLVVMTTHGRTGADRAWLGSVAEELIRRVRVPVLLVRPQDATRGIARRNALFRRVVVALDGSRIAERALDHAAAIGSLDGASFELVEVVDPTRYVFTPYVPEMGSAYQEAVDRAGERAGHYLRELAAELATKGVPASTLVIDDVDPARAILRHAAASGADLLAIGTHGRGAIGRIMLGSVADKVIRGAEVPVLVVPRSPAEARSGDLSG